MPTDRAAAAADLPAIARIAEAAFRRAFAAIISAEQMEFDLRRAYTLEALTRQMTQEDHRFQVALDDGVVVGFASASAASGRWRLHKMYVDPSVQGRGFGALLLDAVVDECRRRDLAAVELYVNRTNPAVAFYSRHGFAIEREADSEIGPGFWRRDYLMVRTLTARSC